MFRLPLGYAIGFATLSFAIKLWNTILLFFLFPRRTHTHLHSLNAHNVSIVYVFCNRLPNWFYVRKNKASFFSSCLSSRHRRCGCCHSMQHIRNKTPVHSYLLHLICIRARMNRYNIIYTFVSLFGLRLDSFHNCYNCRSLIMTRYNKKCILQYEKKHAGIRRRWHICLWHLCLIRNKMKMLCFNGCCLSLLLFLFHFQNATIKIIESSLCGNCFFFTSFASDVFYAIKIDKK